jgi:hypothetical protein
VTLNSLLRGREDTSGRRVLGIGERIRESCAANCGIADGEGEH